MFEKLFTYNTPGLPPSVNRNCKNLHTFMSIIKPRGGDSVRHEKYEISACIGLYKVFDC